MNSIDTLIHRESSSLQALEGFPDTELWRLFTDLDRQKREPDSFELLEPGYYKAIYNAFFTTMNAPKTNISADILCQIHDLCMTGVKDALQGTLFLPGFQTGYSYDLSDLYITDEARREWDIYHLIWTEDSNEDPRLYLAKHFDQEVIPIRDDTSSIALKVDSLFRDYYTRIANQNNEKSVIREIVNLCRSLEIFHPFSDGNQRTIAFVLLPKLLVENGCSLTILEDPFLFDGGFSTEEMVTQVYRGIDHFQCVKNSMHLRCSHALSIKPRSITHQEMRCAIQAGSTRFMRAILHHFSNDDTHQSRKTIEERLVKRLKKAIQHQPSFDAPESEIEIMIEKLMEEDLYALSFAITEILSQATQQSHMRKILATWTENRSIYTILDNIKAITNDSFQQLAFTVLIDIAQCNKDGHKLLQIAKSITDRIWAKEIFQLSANTFLAEREFTQALTVSCEMPHPLDAQELITHVAREVVNSSSLSALHHLIEYTHSKWQGRIAFAIALALLDVDRIADASYLMEQGFVCQERAVAHVASRIHARQAELFELIPLPSSLTAEK